MMSKVLSASGMLRWFKYLCHTHYLCALTLLSLVQLLWVSISLYTDLLLVILCGLRELWDIRISSILMTGRWTSKRLLKLLCLKPLSTQQL
uniref:Uncharacterized protein n=1 Tax=Arundo donax TaxID=35708 RepID=A0A0A9AWT5_ARUDO